MFFILLTALITKFNKSFKQLLKFFATKFWRCMTQKEVNISKFKS